MATHSSVLAWRIPGTGEPGGLPSMGSHSRTQLKRLSSSSIYVVLGILRLSIFILREHSEKNKPHHTKVKFK